MHSVVFWIFVIRVVAVGLGDDGGSGGNGGTGSGAFQEGEASTCMQAIDWILPCSSSHVCRAPSQYIKRLVCIFTSSEAAVVLVFYVSESKSSGAHGNGWVKFLCSATAARRRTRPRCRQLDHSHKPRGSLTGFPRASPSPLTRAMCSCSVGG